LVKPHSRALGSPSEEGKSYNPVLFDSLVRVEDDHFWFRTRNRIIDTMVRQVNASLQPGYRVLEIGCGTGNVLRVLEQACPNALVLGIDLYSEGLRFARQRVPGPLLQADINNLPFKSKMHLVCMFDVLEHLRDDENVLRLLYDIVAPGGTLFLTVPAHPSLWSFLDEAYQHCRRYELGDLEKKLSQAGFQVLYATQFMTVIYPFVWLSRKLRFINLNRDALSVKRINTLAVSEFKIIPIINPLFASLLSIEIPFIAKRKNLPVGTSLLALAHKPSN
jgi:SAM-dependent methyltransferase